MSKMEPPDIGTALGHNQNMESLARCVFSHPSIQKLSTQSHLLEHKENPGWVGGSEAGAPSHGDKETFSTLSTGTTNNTESIYQQRYSA
jgi:hypothetical protein